jgi:hypothetical protein
MTSKEFAAWAQGYYGPYPAGQHADITEYLHWLTAGELDELKIQMRATCPSHIGQVNGYPPDIEGMEKLIGEVRRVLRDREREAREVAYAAKMLPAPGDIATTDEDLVRLDWSAILRGRVRSA